MLSVINKEIAISTYKSFIQITAYLTVHDVYLNYMGASEVKQ